ncbi:MAG: hypothetical protein EPO01_21380 [Aquabacterium sp.]|nr:MAG: hypothetical protein EPO01_21380 [Aquabacterium sp.]
MFLSHESFEVSVPPQLARPTCRYFRAMELSLHAAWYLVTFYDTADPMRLLHSFCCSRDRQILDWLRTGPRFVVTSVQQIRPAQGPQAGWEVDLVRRLWTARGIDGQSVLIVEDVDGREYEGLHAEAPNAPLLDRALLAEFDVPQTPPRKPAVRRGRVHAGAKKRRP